MFSQAHGANQPTLAKQTLPILIVAQSYFGHDVSGTPNLAWLTNKSKQTQFFELKSRLGQAIDLGQNLHPLKQFGLQAHHPHYIKNSYLIDLKTHPKWASFDNLFLTLSNNDQLSKHQTAMQQFGINDTTLIRLKQHLTQYPQHQIQKLNQTILKHHIGAQAKLHNWSGQQAAKNFIAQSKKLRFVTANQWAETTLDSLEPDAQQLLIEYLQQQLGLIGLAQAPLNENALTQLGQQLFKHYEQFLHCQDKQHIAQIVK